MGYGVVEERHGRLRHVAHGVIRATPGEALELRLRHLCEGLRRAVALFRPEAVAVEGVFTLRNPRSALILGHARGVALLVAAETDLRVYEYSPARVKKAVGAGGGDGKHAVARMVKAFLGLEEVERADASDALAVAICHLNAARLFAGARTGGPGAPGAARPAAGKKRFDLLGDRLRPAYQRFGARR
jgi:crossover junction endodeoxyribonuclease RuvC